jgi:hypothetical protein
MDKRHFTVVIGSKEHGLYISSKPSSAAKKAVSKLCAANKSKKVEFCLREITQGSKKKTYGPYLGEMKKLKTPIELKGRVIRHEIKVHLKNGKSSTIKTSKKMRGGEGNEPTIPLNETLNHFRNFINTQFHPNKNGLSIKKDMIRCMQSIITSTRTPKNPTHIFYIYRTDPKPKKIISAGAITGCSDEYNNTIQRYRKYLYIRLLLSRERGNRGGTSAIYHILSKLPPDIYGISLYAIPSAVEYYLSLGFVINRTGCLMILDKTQKNIDKLKEIIERKGPITTEFYSNCPYLNYTEEELQSIREKIEREKKEREKIEREKIEREKKEREKIEREKIEREKKERENNHRQSTNIERNRRKPVGIPQTLNQYWNPDKQKWVRPNYSRIEKPSRNEIARKLLRNKFMSKK